MRQTRVRSARRQAVTTVVVRGHRQQRGSLTVVGSTVARNLVSNCVERTRVTGNSAANAGGGANGLIRIAAGTVLRQNTPADCSGFVEGCRAR